MVLKITRLFVTLIVVVHSFPKCLAADDDFEDMIPGLRARYQVANRVVERIDSDISFDWKNSSPDERLPKGSFSAEWNSKLLVKKSTSYTFSVFLQGEIEVRIDGVTVLKGHLEKPSWVAGKAISMKFGLRKLLVRYRKTNEESRCQLYWSSKHFSRELLPNHLLFTKPSHQKFQHIENGRQAVTAFRCVQCHRAEGNMWNVNAPDLTKFGSGTNYDWLVRKIRGKHVESKTSKMPDFGFDEQEAIAIAAYLYSTRKIVHIPKLKTPKDKSKTVKQGEFVFRSLGCLACHTAAGDGKNGLFGGGDLSTVGDKRSEAWLDRWLRDPQSLNADHRMPVFKMSGKERTQLVWYLSSLRNSKQHQRSNNSSKPSADVIVRGKEIVQKAGCVNCHRINDSTLKRRTVLPLAKLNLGATDSCLTETRKKVSAFTPKFPSLPMKEIFRYLQTIKGVISKPSRFEIGRWVLQKNNCLACHPRGIKRGITEVAGKISQHDTRFRGQSSTLIPPNLTAVGDKLHDAALLKSIRGDESQPRLPWLKTRMPRFRFSGEEEKTLLHYLISHDRISAESGLDKDEPSKITSDSQMLIAGNQLIGAGGFSCTACHIVGTFQPKNVTLPTRGSDLLKLNGRMRREFYDRWMRATIRIIPGMEMPSYHVPIAGILDGNLDRQLDAIWQAVHDSRFRAPTNPAAVEKFWAVEPDGDARLIRDVFELTGSQGRGYIARSLAAGFQNGHNMLFDLDRATLKLWTFGDFAHQRSVGKSWFWRLEGLPVVSGLGERTDFALLLENGSKHQIVLPHEEHGTTTRLLSYRNVKTGIEIQYKLFFKIESKRIPITVIERFQPIFQNWDFGHVRSGIEREIVVVKNFTGGKLVFLEPKYRQEIGKPDIKVENPKWIQQGQNRFAIVNENPKQGGITIRYLTSLKRELSTNKKTPLPTEILKPESVTTVPGFDGIRLPIDRAIMPTAITFTKKGTLAFTSLKGEVYLVHDTDGDSIPDKLVLFEEGLAAPFGIIVDGNDLIVAHKPEVLRLSDTDGDGKADKREVIATGWGYSENYHDWACGFARDDAGNLYIALGSDYAQSNRPRHKTRWRGKLLKISPDGKIEPVAHDLRYPMGLARDLKGNIFITDNQGEQNTFNEINHFVKGGHYGVPSLSEKSSNMKAMPAAIQVPHPFTRSVNGIFFVHKGVRNLFRLKEIVGHGIGCEYDNRFLIRFTSQQVGGQMQGAVYPFSKPNSPIGGKNFYGPICGTVSPTGDIIIGSMHDSGWLGGHNTGGIVLLRPNGKLPNGIKELRVVSEGFELTFFGPIDRKTAMNKNSYNIRGYTRRWKGSYSTPDSDLHSVQVKSISISDDSTQVRLTVNGLREGFFYEFHATGVKDRSSKKLWPRSAYYTLHKKPVKSK